MHNQFLDKPAVVSRKNDGKRPQLVISPPSMTLLPLKPVVSPPSDRMGRWQDAMSADTKSSLEE